MRQFVSSRGSRGLALVFAGVVLAAPAFADVPPGYVDYPYYGTSPGYYGEPAGVTDIGVMPDDSVFGVTGSTIERLFPNRTSTHFAGTTGKEGTTGRRVSL